MLDSVSKNDTSCSKQRHCVKKQTQAIPLLKALLRMSIPPSSSYSEQASTYQQKNQIKVHGFVRWKRETQEQVCRHIKTGFF
jgi:hypothetical protein